MINIIDYTKIFRECNKCKRNLPLTEIQPLCIRCNSRKNDKLGMSKIVGDI
jgi:anaerobic ribonucleoside-triphosphate reductase